MLTIESTSTRQIGLGQGRTQLGVPSQFQLSSKPTISAALYFLIGSGLALMVMVVIPLVWKLLDGRNDAPAALFVRIAMFTGNLAALAAVLTAIGVSITGQRMGILWSARNVYSLSRLQMVLWTLLILSGLATLVGCRYFGLLLSPAAGGAANALAIKIPNELLMVMGISLGSGTLASGILSVKTMGEPATSTAIQAATQRTGGDLNINGNVASRPLDCPPLLRDLFQGDDVAKVGTVDIGKVQQAVVTVLLWFCYLAMLAEMFIKGVSIEPDKLPGGSTLPIMSEAFVYLLGISHAGYLLLKAVPGPGGGGTAAQQSLQPSETMPRPAPPTL